MNKKQREERRRQRGGAGKPSQVGSVQNSLQTAFPMPDPNRYENAIIDSYIRSGTLLKVFAINGYQEQGKIRSHDAKVIVMAHEDADGIYLMYKHALSTIQHLHQRKIAISSDSEFDSSSILPDLHAPTLLSATDLEEEWINKFIQNQSNVNLVTMKGYQEHGIIIAHDEHVIVFIRYKGDNPNIIYKSALSTIYMNF